MHRNHAIYQSSSEKLRHQFSKSENALGIGNLRYFWDQNKKQLDLLMDTHYLINNEIRAYLKGRRLILEAPLISSYTKPFRTHLIGKENSDELEEGLTLLGFSEVKLKYGYNYQLISCQVIEPKLIKVVLGFSFWGRNGNN
jgi:hypothetical protein